MKAVTVHPSPKLIHILLFTHTDTEEMTVRLNILHECETVYYHVYIFL